MRDALRNPDTVRKLYDITVETEKKRRSSWHWLSSAYLSSTFSSAVELLKIYTEMLMELRLVADSKLSGFQSEGFRNLLTMIQRELDDDYFTKVQTLLNELKDNDSMLISARLGNYLQGVSYVLRRKNRKGFWFRWAFAPSYTIAPRDAPKQQTFSAVTAPSMRRLTRWRRLQSIWRAFSPCCELNWRFM